MRGRLSAASVCAVVLLTTCTRSTPPPDNDAGSDAGRGWLDSGSRDAARPDATRDVGRDAPEDAPRDGGPNDPEWVRLGGQPEGVDLYTARHPERVLTVSWETCGVGCERAVCDRLCPFREGWADGGDRVAQIQNADDLQTAMLLDIGTGRIIAAWRLWDVTETVGRLAFPSFGGGRIAISAKAYPTDVTGLLSVWVVDAASVATTLEPVYQYESASSLIDMNLVSATHHAFGITPTGGLFLRDAAGAQAPMATADAPGSLIPVRLVNDRVYFERWLGFEGPVVAMTGTVDRGPVALVDARPAGDVREFHTDGVTMTWYQVYDYDPGAGRSGRFELWTSPIATRSEDVRPRRVCDVAGYYRGEVGGHWFVSQAAGYELDIYDLDDGSRRHWDAPDGNNILEAPLYVTDDEILVTSSRNAYRIDPNTLPIVEP